MIVHIVSRDEWNEAKRVGIYSPSSVQAEGFVHCSTIAQVTATANRLFHGRKNLVLLCIDESRLQADVRFEPSMEETTRGDVFPHIYGPIELDAVVQVLDFACEADGSFSLPSAC